MSAVKTGRGEIIIEKIGLESCQAIEVVFGPLPDIAVRVVEPHGVGRVHVDRLWWEERRVGKREGGRGREGERERGKEGEEGEGGKESERGEERGREGRREGRKEGEEGRREVREGGREGEGERRIKMDKYIDGLDRQRDRGRNFAKKCEAILSTYSGGTIFEVDVGGKVGDVGGVAAGVIGNRLCMCACVHV